MDTASQDNSTKFAQIKKDVHESYMYFKDNYNRFNDFFYFTFVDTLTEADKSKLIQLGKPLITGNVLEAYLSQRVAQFVKQQPSPEVHSKKAPDRKMLMLKRQQKLLEELMKQMSQAKPQSPEEQQAMQQEVQQVQQELQATKDEIAKIKAREDEMIQFLVEHARDLVSSPQNNQFGRSIYNDTTGGGFGSAGVFTDYVSDRSFDQEVVFEAEKMPCLIGYDPMAQQGHKADGRYAFKCIPYPLEEFNELFDGGMSDKSKKIKYAKVKKPKKNEGQQIAPGTLATPSTQGSTEASFEDFNWGYINGTQKIVMVVEYYAKEYYVENLNLLSDGSTATDDEYADLAADYKKLYVKMPVPDIMRTRPIRCHKIVRYKVYQDGILEEPEETIYDYLPLVFFDGNSKVVRDTASMTYRQQCRPYLYHAKGVQRWKDFCMQTAANEIENMVMSKYICSIEAMPDEEPFKLGYTQPQMAQIILYKAYDDNDTNKALPPPREVQRTPTPPIVMESYYACDRAIQQILGSYDTQPSMQNDLSGKAMIQNQLNSNTAADPYLQNYILSLNQCLLCYFSLLPKVVDTPRSMPVRGIDGKRTYKIVNDDDDPTSLKLDYDIRDFNLVIEAGPSSDVQKQVAIEQLVDIAKAFPVLGNFIQQECGEIIFENINMQGSEAVQDKYTTYKENAEEKQAQKQAQDEKLDMAMKQAEVEKTQGQAKQAKATAIEKTVGAMVELKEHDASQQQFAANVFLEQQDREHQQQMERERLQIEKDNSAASILGQVADIHLSKHEIAMREREVKAEDRRTAADVAIKATTLLHNVHSAKAAREDAKEERESAKQETKESDETSEI